MMKIHLLFQKIIETLRHEGIWSLLKKIKVHLWKTSSVDEFDHTHGTDTCKMEPLWNLKIKSANVKFGERYQATDERTFDALIKFLNLPTEKFAFVDLGCGKGKALLLANSSGFATVIGVEFAEELVEIAEKNIEIYQASRAQVIHGDAESFMFPDGPLLVYIFNSFKLEILNGVLENILSRGQHPTYLVIISAPIEIRESVFSNQGFDYFGCVPSYGYAHVWTMK